jgi:murein DD-endopeptidase MepM/ murein hydrolase activator NlpD
VRDFIGSIRIAFGVAAIAAATGCETIPPPRATPSSQPPAVIADRFAYPLGDGKSLTAAKDSKDTWFNALDFGEDNHLGEDWNKNSGGNTDCGETVYAAANGVISFAGDAAPGWGNVVIVTHSLPDGARIQTLYGHLREILKSDGQVEVREQIGTIGNANGKYLCHLHFELRDATSPMWDTAGAGYSANRSGWLDPSDFIDSRNR